MADELVFVYLGSKLPPYGPAALRLAARHSGLNVTIIGERRLARTVPRGPFSFVELEEFYDPAAFHAARENIALNKDFRKGFWVSTLERFFVLEQFAQSGKLAALFHAELDQLLFGVNELADRLARHSARGVFFPFHSPEKAVASLFYFNDRAAMRSLLDSASTGAPFANEMELLVRWSKEFPHQVIRLPTFGDLFALIPDESLPTLLTAEDCGGIVDAAELGLWVGGRDPRNLELSERPRNHFTYPPGKSVLSSDWLRNLRFDLESSPTKLWASYGGESERVQVFNLHLHAKIHPWIARSDYNLPKLLELSNAQVSRPLPGARFRQVEYVVTKGAARRRRRMIYLLNRWMGILTARVSKCQAGFRRWHKTLAGLAITGGHLRVAQVIAPRVSESALVHALQAYRAIDTSGVSMFEGKRILLLGPAPGPVGDTELSQFDVVARIGYTGAGSGPDQSSARCDVSFLARWHSEALLDRIQSGMIEVSSTRFWLRYDVTDETFASLKCKFEDVAFFPTGPCDQMFSKVIPNFAPQIIMWLLAQRPSELKISNIDLMTTTARPPSYATNKRVLSAASGWAYHSSTMRRSFAQFHNPFTHYSFFASLMTRPAVKFSEQLARIIVGGKSRYRRRLEELYFS